MTLPKWAVPAAFVAFFVLVSIAYHNAGIAEEQARQSLQALNESKDSLKAMKDTLGQLRLDLSVAHGRVDTIRIRSSVTVAKADSWAHIADSIRNSFPIAVLDTGRACRPLLDAYNARTSECALLRVAAAQKDTAIQIGQVALVNANASLAGLQTTVVGLQHRLDIVTAPYTCKVLLFPCPSRTMMFVFGVVGGGVAAKAIH